MKRALGTFAAADLGLWIVEPRLSDKDLKRRNHRPTKGKVSSVRHFRVLDEDWTSCIVWIPRTQRQVDDREADHREICQLASVEVEVTKNG